MTASMIPLGFEVPTGMPVAVPLKHLAICGQTQEAGKTTALEALISRADDVQALTFITKRGEASFAAGRRIEPYFREQTDWQFVASLLEASRGEKLKFERAWIIRASKGARTLDDVHRNVRRLMLTAKGLSADVYLTLDAYLSAIVPQIATVRWASGIWLDRGVNVMDLTGLSVELQHLVIKSALDWILQREHDSVVVIPEAWKFIPEGRGTPVKLAAESYIRQGAASGNYLWIDSQDLGGITKVILRSVPVWVLGVQREANEIKRTLANIPGNVAKPKAADLATLELGQFYVCWGKHALRTYVQPTWLSTDLAIAIATDRVSVHDVRLAAERRRAGTDNEKKGEDVDAKERAALDATIAELRRENAELRALLDQGRRDRIQSQSDGGSDSGAHHHGTPHPGAGTRGVTGARSPAHPAGASSFDDSLYQAVKARLIAELPTDPRVMEIVLARPELRVKVQRHILTIDGRSLRGRIARLIADEYFDQARTSANVLDELLKRGADRPSNIELGTELKALCDMGFFTRDNKWYSLVPGMKVSVVEAA